jgi:hypothetical protein
MLTIFAKSDIGKAPVEPAYASGMLFAAEKTEFFKVTTAIY